jgi:hypothetical protein
MFEITERGLTAWKKKKMQGFAILCRVLHNNARCFPVVAGL